MNQFWKCENNFLEKVDCIIFIVSHQWTCLYQNLFKKVILPIALINLKLENESILKMWK